MEILGTFGIQPILLLAQVINFAILLFILQRFMYKPILKVLDERKARIAKSLKDAEEVEKKLAETEEDREKALEKAASEAKKILQEATTTASQIVEEAHTRAQGDIDLLIKKNKQALNSEREKLQQEIRENIADLVVVAVEKVSGKVLDKKDQKEIIERSIKDLR